MSKRFDVLREIERLDAERDHQRIVHLSFGYEFPWDSIRALEIALYRTYCVPTISALLDRTGEFRERTQQRYDDTSLIIAEMCKWGYESGRGKEALERMNWAHGHFKISNDDFLYVLSTFIYEPVRWIDCIRSMCADGIDHFVETGPGAVLSGLIRRITPSAETAQAGDDAAIDEIAQRLPVLTSKGDRGSIH